MGKGRAGGGRTKPRVDLGVHRLNHRSDRAGAITDRSKDLGFPLAAVGDVGGDDLAGVVHRVAVAREQALREEVPDPVQRPEVGAHVLDHHC